MQIRDVYVVVLEEATTLNNEPYKGWRREKYIGKEGVLLIVENNESQHIQWHPIENDIILFTKGIVSSNDDVTRDGDRIIVETLNSYYYFSMIQKKINITDEINLW